MLPIFPAAKICCLQEEIRNNCYIGLMYCEICDVPLFKGGDKNVIERVMHDSPSRFVSYAKGDIIAMQGSACRSLYVLCEGRVFASMVSEEGRELTLATLDAPDVLASSFIFSSSGVFPVTIIADSDCDIWVVNKESIFNLIREDQTILRNFLKVVSDHSMFLSQRLVELALQTLSSRIVNYIENNGPIRNLQQTAFILGVARPSLSRVISQLVSQGVLRKDASGYTLV